MSGNVEFMKRFVEFINSAGEKLAHELVSPDAIFHAPVRPEPVVGPAGYLMIIGMMRGGFPDVQWTLEELISEGDKVAVYGRSAHRETSHHTGAEYLPSDKRSDHQRVRPT
jgi:predicted ester cyclase